MPFCFPSVKLIYTLLTHGIFTVFHRNLFYFCIFACVCVKIIVYTNFMSDEINEITEEHSDYNPTDARDESVKHQLTGMYQNWLLDYASYVILERAVPHIIDGL